MGKVKKSAGSKHDASISPGFAEYISKLSTVSLAELPSHLASLSPRWPYPRGDLYHWITSLDRFDSILEDFNVRYGLNLGPQNRPFGVLQLLEGSHDIDENKLEHLGFGPEGDRELVQSILLFTKLLLEKCGNRNLYNSTDRINDLLSTTSLPLLHTTLRLASCVAQRHREKTRRDPGQVHFSHCSLDLDKLQRISTSAFMPSASDTKTDAKPLSPLKTSKSREKSSQSSRVRVATASCNPDDFRSMLKGTFKSEAHGKGTRRLSLTEKDWLGWANLRMVLQPSGQESAADVIRKSDEPDPSTPTPFRRQPSTSGQRLSGLSFSQDQNGIATAPSAPSERQGSGTRIFEISHSELQGSSIDDILKRSLPEVPAAQHYELLHKLRSAYALLSPKTRQLSLEIRLLAIANLACVLYDGTFGQKVFGTDQDPSRRQRLIQQSVSLLSDGGAEKPLLPLSTQSAALELLSALSKQKLTSSEVVASLGVSSSHGILLALTRRGVADLAHDSDATDNPEGDEWRELLFGMLKVTLEATVHFSRPIDAFASSSIITTYLHVLTMNTCKALRVQLKILDFCKHFYRHFKDGLSTLSTHKAFEAVCHSFGELVKTSLELTRSGNGFPMAFKTPSTDYQTPYLHQLVIRSILDLINDVSGHQGAHADRVLRELIDSQVLLGAFRTIVDNGKVFGAHTWSEVVKCVSGFLHHEPTSYTIISEAGLSRSLLQSVTLEDIPVLTRHNTTSTQATEDSSPPALESMSQEHPEDSEENSSRSGRQSKTLSAEPQRLPQGILASKEAIEQIAQAFGAICLTNAGFDLFKSSGALPKFFEIFESPQHVKAMKDGNLLAILGSTFDELVRHHPNLKPMVISAVVVMIARIRNICRNMTWQIGAGPKLWDTRTKSSMAVCGGSKALLFEIGADPQVKIESIKLPDGNILESTESMPSDIEVTEPREKDADGLGIMDYLIPSMTFLATFFENQQLCMSFMDGGGTDFVLELVTIPSLHSEDHAFGATSTVYELVNIVHSMAETKPHIILPILLSRALTACQDLQHFVDYQPRDSGCYFKVLVTDGSDSTDAMDLDDTFADGVSQNGTKIVRCLTAIQSLMQVLADVFQSPIYSNRTSQTSPFAQVNLADKYAELCHALGKISAACIREDLAILGRIPDMWLTTTRPGDFHTGNDDINGILSLGATDIQIQQNRDLESSQPGLGDLEAPTTPNGHARSKEFDSKTSKPEEQTPAFRNVQILRCLLLEVPQSITHFFSFLNQGFNNKRKDVLQKQNVIMVGRAMAEALISQLKPYFFDNPLLFGNSREFIQSKFSYLAVVLSYLKQTILGPSMSSDHDEQCMLFVTLAFKDLGGFELLTEIGTDFFDQLKTCETSEEVLPTMTSANSGLKISLDILVSLTSHKCVVESQQAATFKNADPTKPFYFVPSQFLLELRMLALPLTRAIWESEYVYQASQAVVESLVSIFKNILNGDHEHDAYKTADTRPHIISHKQKRFIISATDLALLQSRGIAEGLASEALFRCHNNEHQAHEYCLAISRNPRRPRCQIPQSEVEGPILAIGTAHQTVVSSNPMTPPTGEPGDPSYHDESQSQEDESDDAADDAQAATAMSISNILNRDINGISRNGTDQATPDVNGNSLSANARSIFTVQTMNAERETIRQDLVDRCLNLLGSQSVITFELSELIMSGAKKLSEETANNYRQDTSNTCIQFLLSMQDDQITESQGKKIAATAHLVALLIQDKDFYDKSESLLVEAFENLTLFIKVPPHNSEQNIPEFMPWIGPVLLIIEKMLCNDTEPPKVIWRMPTDLSTPAPAIFHRNVIVSPEQKKRVFDAILNVLPSVGKDRSLALSLARVLVVLTRRRELATTLAEKHNLQRVSLLIKQLAAGFDERLQSAIMIVLRHIVEDDETIRQIMRSEIVAYMSSRNTRQIDTTSYVRDLYALILRSPEIFVEVTKEKVKLHHFDLTSRPQQLILKTLADPEKADIPKIEHGSTEPPSRNRPQESVESGEGVQEPAKMNESKPPVVERPDGLIHFLLSELLNNKILDDNKTLPSEERPDAEPSSVAETVGNNTPERSEAPLPDGQPSNDGKSVKTPFKIEDHPHYLYRCFILQCLTELLHSYNRTKVEFINFSRKADPQAATPSKPRSGVLNYLLNALITTGSIDMEDSTTNRKTTSTSTWAINVIVALCSKTGEMGLSSSMQRYSTHSHVEDKDDEPDLAFVRRFVLEHAIKAFKDATSSPEAPPTKYPKMMGLAELFNKLITKPSGQEGFAGSYNNSYRVLSRVMFEKNLISILTSALAEIDLSYSKARLVIKYILRPLNELTNTAAHLSLHSSTPISSALGTAEEDVISSASSSVSEMEDEREETPDFFRNSTLGMMEPHRHDQSSSDTDDEADEEEIYDDGYEDEMEYEDMAGGAANDGEVVSDEDIDEHMPGPGPVEGLPGDIPVNIELVMEDGPHMGVDSDEEDDEDDDEDEDDSEDDDDDDDEDDDGDSFIIEGDDAILEGDINGDNQNDSLDGDPDNGDDWEDEDHGDEDGDYDEELPDGAVGMVEMEGGDQAQALTELLRVVDEGAHDQFLAEMNGEVPRGPMSGNMPIPAEDENEDDEGEEEEMEDQADMVMEQFNDMLDMDDNMLDHEDQWAWDEPPPWVGRHRHVRGAGGMPSFLGRHGRPPADIHHLMTRPHRHHQPPPARASGDDGTNPLLQRQGASNVLPRGAVAPVRFSSAFDANLPAIFHPMMQAGLQQGNIVLHPDANAAFGGPITHGGHGGMLDNLVQLIQQSRNIRGAHGTRLDFNVNVEGAAPGAFQLLTNSMVMPAPAQRNARDSSFRSVSFTPAMTQTRWQEEARLLFGNTWPQIIQRVVNPLLDALVPAAQIEEKARQDRLKEEQELREAEARLERERMEKEAAEAERKRHEDEEREAAAKAAAEAEELAARAAAAALVQEQSSTDPEDGAELMEDVQITGENPAQEDASVNTTATETTGDRIFTTIRGQQLDITGMSIDAEYLEALPEELREEVIMQQYTAQREQAQEQGGNAEDAIDPEFLNALPEDLREEVRQAEAHATRRRERDAARREAAQGGGPARAEEMDADSFFATLDPVLRIQILSEQREDMLQHLDPRLAAEGRAHAQRRLHYQGLPVGTDPRGERGGRDPSQRDNKRQIVQMVDQAGVATLLRLMFLPQQGSMKSNLQFILRNVCGNRQTRFEVINLFLLILKEGSTDVSALERSLASLSLRAKASGPQKTPQPLKRTLSLQAHSGINEEMTPLMIVQQCLDALKYLSRHDNHVKSIFLREVDTSSTSKSKPSRKGKGKENRGIKYPLNDLIGLLDRKLIMESSTCLQSCAELLGAVTSPLILLSKEAKAHDAARAPLAGAAIANGQEIPSLETVHPTTESPTGPTEPSASSANEDTNMIESDTSNIVPPIDGQAFTSAGRTMDAAVSATEEDRTKKPFEPPVVPDHNLRLVVSILTAQECNHITFNTTLESIRSLSYLPSAGDTFREELIKQAQTLSLKISSDLDALLPLIQDGTSGTEFQNLVSSKFSPSGSDQGKLLRVLLGLNWLYDPVRAVNQAQDGNEAAPAKSVLNSSYEILQLGPVWSKLGDCLSAVQEKDNVLSFATILLPLIESLMVVCKNTSLKETPLARQVREQSVTSPPPESVNDLEELFFNFTTEHRKILNEIVRQNPKLMQGTGSFAVLVKNPKVLEFDNKRNYFTKQTQSRQRNLGRPQPPLQLSVRRSEVFLDSFKSLYFKSADEMKYGKLSVRFHNEEGVDAGGVSREWWSTLARGMFDPNYALWQPVASDKTTFHPSSLSGVNDEHLMFFKFIGRIIGKAVHEGRVLDCHFSRPVYKKILGRPISIKDMESLDIDYYKSLMWILENDITDIISEDFSVVTEVFGEEKIIDLIPDGRNIPVNEENKAEYVQKLVEHRLIGSVKEQLDHFVDGFHNIVPSDLVSIFNESELELLISGLPEINVDDWKANTDYHSYSASSQQIQWFWRAVKSFTEPERAALLQFITGTSKVPLNGFKELEGMHGITRCSIHRDPSKDRLPSSHTCFNQLDLPEYDSYESLKKALLTACEMGGNYFGFA